MTTAATTQAGPPRRRRCRWPGRARTDHTQPALPFPTDPPETRQRAATDTGTSNTGTAKKGEEE
ncbi:hypothetical protein [Glycomyces paridis]|uniref:hypothetical protein n=1 Tax=Glycomyces paridis TaxID=2126555 RepID=UPI0013051BDA|nr:hypothetical protein [Glycomyces paridis]